MNFHKIKLQISTIIIQLILFIVYSSASLAAPATNPSADINNDGIINLQDLVLISNDFSKTSNFNPRTDLASPYGTINLFDAMTVIRDWGNTVDNTPPPATGFCSPHQPATSNIVTVSNAAQLQNAVANAQTGQTIVLADGTYTLTGTLYFNTPGITLRSQSGNRDAVIIDGNYQVGEIIYIGVNNIKIIDLTLKRATWHPIHIAGLGTNSFIYNVKIIDGAQQQIKINGIGTQYPDNGTIACSHIELTSAGRTQVEATSSCYTGGIDAHQVRGWIVRDNTIKEIWCNSGLAEHAIHFWSGSRDTIVERNTIINNARGIGFGLSGGGASLRTYSDITNSPAGTHHYNGVIKNNFVYANIAGFDTGIGLESAWGTKVYHNTVYSAQGFSGIDIRFTQTNADVRNNLISPGVTIRDGAVPILNTNNIGATSNMFVNLATGNLHLLSTATSAINKGTSLSGAVPQDIDGSNRDSQPDVGADEVGNATIDIIPPSQVTGLTAIAATSTQINLGWNSATDNIGVNQYTIYRNNNYLGTSIGTTYQDTGLTQNTTYTYKVSARDAAGNSGLNSTIATATTNSTVSNPPTTGLLGQWNFNEGSGTTASDSSGNGNSATLMNGATWTTGRYGSGISFDGVDDYLSLGNPSILNPTTGITLSAWIYPTDMTVARGVLMKYDGSTNSQYLLRQQGSNFRMTIQTSTGSTALTSTATLTANAWNHIAGTYDGTIMRLYLNGVEVSTLAKTGNLITTSVPFEIGRMSSTTGAQFIGLIDEARIYGRALSQSEIQSVMQNSTVPVDTTAPSQVTGLTASTINAGQINLAWTAATDNIAVTGYRIFRNGVQVATSTGTIYSDSGLNASTTYNYRVAAYDASGNIGTQSTQVSATTTSDTTAPSQVTGLSATAMSTTQINLAWTAATDNVAVTGYRTYRNNVQVGTSATNTYQDTNLAVGTTYNYKVAAYDGAGNLGTQSTQITAATFNNSGSPQTQRLIQQSNLAYLGMFTVPDNDGTGRGNSLDSLSYGSFALGMGQDGASLYFGCHDWHNMIARISIPAIGQTANILMPCTAINNIGAINPGDSNGYNPGGTLVWNGKLIATAYAYYDAGGTALGSHFVMQPDMTGQSGPFRIGPLSGSTSTTTDRVGMQAGYMGIIPPEWRSLLGGPALTGLNGIPIISRTSAGPTVTVFNPDDVGTNNKVITMLLGYPYEHQTLGGYSQANPLFSGADTIGGFAFPTGTRSILFVGRHATTFCYGYGTNNQAIHGTVDANGVMFCYDPTDSNKGGHGYPYIHQIWAYDANDLLAVKQGTKLPWDLRPYATWQLTNINNNGNAPTITSATFDPATNKFYLAIGRSIHVYQIN